MNEMEPFEQRLKSQPPRQVPAVWRQDILSAAREAQPLQKAAIVHRESLFSLLSRRLASLFWPHPVAWGGLAAIWILIFAVHLSQQDNAPAMAKKVSTPSPEMIAELGQQQRLLVELMGAKDASDADRPKLISPAPRSERVVILTV
jgi:hypothetical protein